MEINLDDISKTEVSYRIRWMACLAIAEALILAVVLFWPVPAQQEVFQDIEFSDNEISLDEVQVTTQRNSPPPPPRPQVPVPVPNDRIIEEEILVLDDIDILDFTDTLSVEGRGRQGNTDQVTANPQTSPSVIRIVEPTVPEAARKEGIKAEIWVSFLVDKSGAVEEATISQIKLYDRNEDEFQVTQSIGFGIAEATIEAALQWKFRPAKDQGSPVRAYTRHIFTYGF